MDFSRATLRFLNYFAADFWRSLITINFCSSDLARFARRSTKVNSSQVTTNFADSFCASIRTCNYFNVKLTDASQNLKKIIERQKSRVKNLENKNLKSLFGPFLLRSQGPRRPKLTLVKSRQTLQNVSVHS